MTSDDVAFAAAAAACTAVGGTLYLPAGKILLTGAAQTILSNCSLVGSGGLVFGPSPNGTMFYITSTSVSPFVAKGQWSLSRMSFYWPNQTTGTTVYPPLVKDNGTSESWGTARVSDITIVNAYDGFVQSPNTSGGAVQFSNATMFAVHDLFRLTNTGDLHQFNQIKITPGAWLSICGAGCYAAVDVGLANSTVFRVASNGAGGNSVNITTSKIVVFGARYLFQIDNGGVLSLSNIDIGGGSDGIGTIIKNTAGGLYTAQNSLSGFVGSCAVVKFSGGASTKVNCFEMGATGPLTLDNLFVGGVTGSFIVTASDVTMRNSTISSVGSIADGLDYYAIQMTAGNGKINVQGSTLGGRAADTKVHGIVTTGATPTTTNITGNYFSSFNDAISLQTSPLGMIVANNTSLGTTGSNSVVITGTNGVVYTGNQFDRPPTATTSACGAGSSASGALQGFISVGSTNPTNSCNLKLPFVPMGGDAGNCIFQMQGGQTVTGTGPSGGPPTWGINFSATAHSQKISFSCMGIQ